MIYLNGKFLFVCVFLLLLSCSVFAYLANSPWPMFHKDLKHTGKSPYNTSHIDGTIKWVFDTDGGIESSPAIGKDGTIYIGSHDGFLYALDPDGTEKWKYNAGPPVYDADHDTYNSILSSPSLSEYGPSGSVYFTSLTGKLFVLDSEDGSLEWSYPLSLAPLVWTSPVVSDVPFVYVGDSKALYAVKMGGSLDWSFPLEDGVTCSPAVDSAGNIYFCGGDVAALVSVDSSGVERWRFVNDKYTSSSPAIASDGTIYFASSSGYLYALSSATGAENWRFHIGQAAEFYSSPAIASDGTIYIGSPLNKFYAVNPGGSLKWQFSTSGPVSSSPAIGSDGTVYFGVNPGGRGNDSFFALNPWDGSVKWSAYLENASIVSSPAIASDGTIYVGSNDSKFYAFGETPDEGSGLGNGVLDILPGDDDSVIEDVVDEIEDTLDDLLNGLSADLPHGGECGPCFEPDGDGISCVPVPGCVEAGCGECEIYDGTGCISIPDCCVSDGECAADECCVNTDCVPCPEPSECEVNSDCVECEVCVLDSLGVGKCMEDESCSEEEECPSCPDCPEAECPEERILTCFLCVGDECEMTSEAECDPCSTDTCFSDSDCVEGAYCDGSVCRSLNCSGDRIVVDHECADAEDFVREFFDEATSENNVEDDDLIETIREVGAIEDILIERIEADSLPDDLAEQIAALLAEAEDTPAVAEENLERVRELLAAEGIVVPPAEPENVFASPAGLVLGSVAGAIIGIISALSYLAYRRRKAL